MRERNPGPDPLERQFRRHAGKVSRQATVALAGTVFLIFGGYLFKIYVSRELGAKGLGIYALGMTIVGFFSLFATLGMPEAAARFVSIYRGAGDERKVRDLLRRGLLRVAAASGVLGAAVVVLRRWLAEGIYQEPELAPFLPWFALILVLGAVQAFLGQYLRGLQEIARRTLINRFIGFPVKVLVTVGLFSLGWRLSGYVAAEIAGLLVMIFLLATVARRLTSSIDPPPPASGKPAAAPSPGLKEGSYAASMVGLQCLGFVAGRADVVLLGIFLAASEVGIYSIAVTTAAFVPTLLKSLNSIFGPMIADLHARHQTSLLERLFQTSTKWCLGLTWPLVIVIVLFAREILSLFGPGFEAGAPALALLAVGQLVNVGVGSVGNLLVMSGHQRLEIASVASAAALTLPLNVLLIPRWGMLGAALALASSMAASNLLRAVLVWIRLGLRPYNPRALSLLVPVAASALATFGVWWWIRPRVVFWALLVALAGAYATFLLTAAVFALERDDRIILRAVAEKFRGYLDAPARRQ